LYPENDYYFIAESIDSNGTRLQSDPVTSRLRIVVATPGPTFNSGLPTPIPYIHQAPTLEQTIQEARAYSVSRSGSFIFLILATLLYILLILIEETTLVILVDWIIGLSALPVGRSRHHRHSFSILDALTNRGVSRAEVTVIHDDKIVQTFLSDFEGKVRFSWPLDQPVQIRITKRGYEATTVTFDHEVTDIRLEPVTAAHYYSGLSTKFIFHLKHSLRFSNLVLLVVGTLLLIPSLFSPGWVALGTFLGYIVLWALFLYAQPREYHIAQIVDQATKEPVAYAHVVTYTHGKQKHLVSDHDGYLTLAYPLPEKISIMKEGYTLINREHISMTAITADPIVFGLQPREA
jgi:hypothetical protein